ncbi:class I SAM-dependent methyltransferase [Candidatus Gracilibacteria bacterium]|nr:class I SAM-dependent methyltransferase [Candidatus Gracilibacteria bacterium]
MNKISRPPVDIRFEIRLDAESETQLRAAYDQLHARHGLRQLDSFYRWLLRLLDPVPGRSLLDVATGEGVLPNFAQQLYGLIATGTDVSARATQIAGGAGGAGFCVAEGERLPFADRAFDYVTCIGSLEHFFDMHAGVAEMARVLRPTGSALILVPNTYSIIGNVYQAWKTGMSSIDPQPLQRYAARAEWAMLLERNGLQVERAIKYEREAPDTLADALWYMQHPRRLVKLALTPLIPLNLASCFVFLCRPNAEGLGCNNSGGSCACAWPTQKRRSGGSAMGWGWRSCSPLPMQFSGASCRRSILRRCGAGLAGAVLGGPPWSTHSTWPSLLAVGF